MSLREHYPNHLTTGCAHRSVFRFLRTCIVPQHGHPGPLSYVPYTWVLAERRVTVPHAGEMRQIYFVDLRGPSLFQDGVWWPRANRLYRDSTIVDAVTLGPVPRKRRRDKLTIEQLAYLRHWRRYYKATWAQILAKREPVAWAEMLAKRKPDCEALRTSIENLVEWFVGPRVNVLETMYRSELGLSWVGNRIPLQYVREILYRPELPNEFNARIFGSNFQCIAYMKIDPAVQANAGLKEFVQRAFYLVHPTDASLRCDGIDKPSSWKNCVSPRLLYPGVPSTEFDGHLEPVDPISRSQALGRRDEFLKGIK